MGEKSIDSMMALERGNNSHLSTIHSLEQVDCASEQSISQVYSNEIQEQCKLFHKKCCHRRKEYHSCLLGKKIASNQSDECAVIKSLEEKSNLMETLSICCTMCRSLTSSRSIELCSSKSRNDYIRQFGNDFHECCPVISGSLRVLIRNTDTSNSDSSRPREDTLTAFTHHKSSNYSCFNKTESGCNCSPGFRLQGDHCIDINECQFGSACPPGHRCDNTLGSFICVRQTTCGTGYTWNHDLRECEDNDECSDPVNPCPSGTTCRNIRGSYRCDASDYTLDDEMVANLTGRKLKNPSLLRSKCQAGFQFSSDTSPSNCVDVDECTTRVHACPPGTLCRNIIGSYLCEKICPPGYAHRYNESSYSNECIDVDECTRGEHSCGANNDRCVNTPGSYQCQCKDGFFMAPTAQCIDINECSSNASLCPADQVCINLPGSYVCRCKEGFEKMNDICIDINECEKENTCISDDRVNSRVCINTPGSYRCDCKAGFIKAFNGSCVDLNECTTSNPCAHHLDCINTIGSFNCKCPRGYNENIEFSTISVSSNQHHQSCSDIDECAVASPCSDDYICINTAGSHKCVNVDCKLLGDRFVPDVSNRNRCKRLLSCTNYFTSIGFKGSTLPIFGGASSCREEIHAFTFLSLPSNVTFGQNSSRLELLAIRTAPTAKCTLTTSNITDGGESHLKLPTAIIAYQSISSKSGEHFSLIHQPSQSVVRVGLIKPLIGPRILLARVICTTSNHKVARAVTDILVTVSRYPF